MVRKEQIAEKAFQLGLLAGLPWLIVGIFEGPSVYLEIPIASLLILAFMSPYLYIHYKRGKARGEFRARNGLN